MRVLLPNHEAPDGTDTRKKKSVDYAALTDAGELAYLGERAEPTQIALETTAVTPRSIGTKQRVYLKEAKGGALVATGKRSMLPSYPHAEGWWYSYSRVLRRALSEGRRSCSFKVKTLS